MTVTCQTVGCGNEGIALDIADTWLDRDGTVQPVTVVQCGVCFEWIIPPSEPISVGESADETDTTEPPEIPGVSS